eukprot:TRINITY_DN30833_c0_g1_i2.p2 TRINITY_DN30833_c0_g1~~TRINITY_DN30833_c0_g1_i2.p2  ORF type:complete len:115 (-),score=30.25 TRINITY_DN30833_c0_g1_i2:99-443(-)
MCIRDRYNNLYEQKYHRKKLSNDVKKLDKMKFIENQQQEKIQIKDIKRIQEDKVTTLEHIDATMNQQKQLLTQLQNNLAQQVKEYTQVYEEQIKAKENSNSCLLYTSPSPRDQA